MDSNLIQFFIYSLCVYFVSIFFGTFLSRLVRYFNLDKKFKIFRYRNHWFYIFSGEILHFNKFKEKFSLLNKPDMNQYKVDMVYADVLTQSGGETSLFKGFVVDYELDNSDISKLDKVYLLDASRYKRTKIIDENSNELEPLQIEKKQIPGSVFIIPGSQIINLNVLYVVSEKVMRQTDNNKTRLSKLKKIVAFILLILIFILTGSIFINFEWLNNFTLFVGNQKTDLFDKALVAILVTQLVPLALGEYDENGHLSFSRNLINRAKYFLKSFLIIGLILLVKLIVIGAFVVS